jgi:hypothetical protein
MWEHRHAKGAGRINDGLRGQQQWQVANDLMAVTTT